MNKKEILSVKLDVYRKIMKNPKSAAEILQKAQINIWNGENVSVCNKVIKQTILEGKEKR